MSFPGLLDLRGFRLLHSFSCSVHALEDSTLRETNEHISVALKDPSASAAAKQVLRLRVTGEYTRHIFKRSCLRGKV